MVEIEQDVLANAGQPRAVDPRRWPAPAVELVTAQAEQHGLDLGGSAAGFVAVEHEVHDLFGHASGNPVVPRWLGSLLFGFLEAAAIRLQGVSLPGLGQVPVQAIQALPYVMTVVLLAGFIGSAVAPQALGKPYFKER